MQELLAALGINGKLLLSQGVNFLVLLGGLTALVYRPLLRLLEERKRRIEFGLRGADEAERQLREIARDRETRLREADAIALQKIHEAEERGHARHDTIVADAAKHARALMDEAAHVAAQKKEEEMQKFYAESQSLLRAALARAVALEPAQIDERLLNLAQESLLHAR